MDGPKLTLHSDESTPTKRQWFKRHKKLVIILSIVLVLLIGGGTATALYLTHPKAKPAPAKVVKKTPPKTVASPKYYSPLTGVQVATQADETTPVTAVMIENSPDARPQSGLKDSGVVFEAIAEGGITRFMAIY